MPLLMHNFSKDFDFSSQMTELVDGLRCSDDSKLQLDPESLTKISLEIVEYFQRFEAPYQSASSRQMNLRQMFGILQTFEGFQKFGFAVKAPTKRNSCNQSEFANSANQFLRIGYNPSLDPTSILGMWLNGEIDLSSYGIQQPETIEHEAFHMYLHMFYPNIKLAHIDDLKIFQPLLNLGNLVPMSILGTSHSSYIPNNYITEGVGALDNLLVAATRNSGIPFNLPEHCNSPFKAPGDLFRKFCFDGKPPRLQMDTPYSSSLNKLQALNRITKKTPDQLLTEYALKTLQVECFTAITRGSLDVIATYLELAKERKETLLSVGENASRIGFIAMNENLDSATNIALFSGLITLAKMIEAGSKMLGIGSPQESAQKLVGDISKAIIGEEMTAKISDITRWTPNLIKNLIRQSLFVFTLYAIDTAIKNSQNKDDKIQTPKIDGQILVAGVSAMSSALISGVVNVGADIFFNRRPQADRQEEGVSRNALVIEISSPSTTVVADLVRGGAIQANPLQTRPLQ